VFNLKKKLFRISNPESFARKMALRKKNGFVHGDTPKRAVLAYKRDLSWTEQLCYDMSTG